MKKDDLDVVYVVYDAILQEARQEIEELVGIDICDGIDTAGNYMATTYDCSQEFIDQLKAAFVEKELDIHSDDYSLSADFLIKNINV